MSIIAWIIIGALAGWLASIVTGRNEEMGWAANILVGIVGAIVGGLLMTLLGSGGVSGFNVFSMLVAIGGAILVLFLVNMVRGRPARS
jgi:uncharacterized membrane protein YeaQ/YmgE (transglycosylase-associated protein family)